ncbi:hypothetical protein TspCOW1_28040 [Thiohalobacter sp. COW1]|uniref:DUF4168 domain-containing protein n=1 Tax=Thiohalobacter thiocyanaticus TaxID=585455 RepID=A0A1Z4VUP5_9GAMM|nr:MULTISPECIES: DUF4168 domain-containing protein [Thiohalobacter]BAZ95347.1 uncharacterized protein FOKN1_2990 [Thiohalobacter thiocyanaticus]BCO32701.1 hypothetical protein TspCOW1_28040 [Thiohalobacter sp. COW1]
MIKSVLAPVAIALCGLGLSFSAQAQEYGQGQGGGYPQQGQPPAAQQPGGATAPQVDLSDQEISQFKAAFDEISTIRQAYAGELQNAEDPNKARELQQRAQSEMVEAVEDSGLSVQDYNRIAGAIQQDPELRSQVLGTN